MRILVTGGAGFIGSNFIRWLLKNRPDVQVVNLDKLTYAGNLESLRELEGNPRYRFIRGDITDPKVIEEAASGCEGIVHFAAESHVDRSIVDSTEFLRTNVLGTHLLLEAARRNRVKRFLHISTDEVYGSLAQGAADEEAPLRPNSPYAASKAAADLLALAYHATFRAPILIVRGSNNIGPYQFPEKFIPLMITNALEREPLPLYGDGQYVREWLFVEDFCEAIDLVWERGELGEVYNVGSGEHQINLEVARSILATLGRPKDLIHHVPDRPGHDRRYAVDSNKMRALGWFPRHSFSQSLAKTIHWYQANEVWWRPLKKAAVSR